MPQLTCSKHDTLIGFSPYGHLLLLMSLSVAVLVLSTSEFSPFGRE